MTDVEAGNELGFFLVQNGGRSLDSSVLSSSNLSFVQLSDGVFVVRAGAFTVTIEKGSGANYKNTVGVYEVDANGNIVDVRILSANAKGDAGSSYTVTDVEAGNELGFFLVQNGGRSLDSSVLSSSNLSFVQLSDGTMALAENGVIVGGAKTFLSHGASLNFDSAEKSTSTRTASPTAPSRWRAISRAAISWPRSRAAIRS